MASYDSYKSTIDQFWSQGPTKNLNMDIFADISEAPNKSTPNHLHADNQIVGIRHYKDMTFIAHGAGWRARLKVITPNSIKIYRILPAAGVMKNMEWFYGMFAVISETEVIIAGYYFNLETSYASSYGIDEMKWFRDNTSSMSVISDGTGGWVTAEGSRRESDELVVTQYWKTSPEHCFDCETQRAIEDEDPYVFSKKCKEESFTVEAGQFNMFGREQSLIGDKNFGLSVQRDGALGSPIPEATGDMAGCVVAISKYKFIFNIATLEPSKIGTIGSIVSDKCPGIILKNLGEVLQYREDAISLYDTYLNSRTDDGLYDNEMLHSQSDKIVTKILPFIASLDITGANSNVFESIFSDMIWWAPIFFSFDTPSTTNRNWYIEAGYQSAEAIATIMTAAAADADINLGNSIVENKYIIRKISESGDLIKKSGRNLTTFKMAGSGSCFASKILTSLKRDQVDVISEIEYRENGTLIWGFKYSIDYGNFYSDILLYFVPKNTSNAILIERIPLPAESQPIDGSAKSISKHGKVWKIHDFFYDGSRIKWTTVEVPVDEELDLIARAAVGSYASNIGEFSASSDMNTLNVLQDGRKIKQEDYDDKDLDDSSTRSNYQNLHFSGTAYDLLKKPPRDAEPYHGDVDLG